MKPSLLVFLLILPLVLFHCESSDVDSKEKIDAQILQMMEEKGVPTLATCLLRKDSIFWEGYFQNLGNQSITKNTVYNIASVSKLVTATAVMQLVEAGSIELDEDINQYLDFEVRHPDYPEDPITIRMLLTHRSGMSWPQSADVSDFYDPYRDQTAPELGTWIEAFLSEPAAWSNRRPGAAEGYSNHGASLLGHIVTSVAGIDFKDYCQKNIFDPLKMKDTQFSYDYFDSSAEFAEPYSLGYQYSVPYYPASTLKTSIADFSKFMLTYMNKGSFNGVTLLQPETIELMLTPQNLASSVGLLWFQMGRGFGHSGAFWDATASVDFSPDHETGYIAFINKTQWELSEPGIVYPGGSLYKLIKDHYYSTANR